MKKWIIAIALLITIPTSGFAFNYFALTVPLNKVIKEDIRNTGVEVTVHYKNYINSNVLVFSVNRISGQNSKADVFRVFLQFAATQTKKSYNKVILAYRNQPKFYIDGSYYKLLGEEYGTQNPVYTIRTFPEKVYNIDGSKAFNEWTGGWIGVAKAQMEDFNEFHKKWYLNDMLKNLAN